ncbi:MAG TPA: hypothetical protein VFA77_05685, partial [Candidatus Eisenbacteria bacterium]|nr:hypothetical protein [Candidatus Eisenbacteria bacterium]
LTFRSEAGAHGVYCVVLQPDGKVLAGGYSDALPVPFLSRLNPDGTWDTSFEPGLSGLDGFVESIALQTDGKILLGGSLNTPQGQNPIFVARLNGDSTLDRSFNPKPENAVDALAVQADGKILLGGRFVTLNGQIQHYLGRLNNSSPATQSLNFDGATLTWMRGGASPEVWRTTFEYSSDGVSWTSLGAGVRIPGGWQLTGLDLPLNTTFRARGFAVGGMYNGCSWFVETISAPALAISEALFSANGQFQFKANGTAGRVFVVDASPDLSTWVPLQTNILSADPLLFTDLQSRNFSRRFYRLRSQ